MDYAIRKNLNVGSLSALRLGVASSCDIKFFVWKIQSLNIFQSVTYNYSEGSSEDAFSEFMNPKSFMYESDVAIISVSESIQKLVFGILNNKIKDARDLFEQIRMQISITFQRAANSNLKYIFCVKYPINIYHLGHFELFNNSQSLTLWLKKINDLFFEEIVKYNSRIIPLEYDEVFQNVGVAKIDDSFYGGHLEENGAIYLADLFLEKLVSLVDLKSKIKAIALDLDNTLWDGVLLESPTVPKIYTNRSKALLMHSHNGIPIFVVSKNNPHDLEKIKNSISQVSPALMKGIIGWSISWNPKSQSIREFAAKIGVSTNSIALFDDSEFERREVEYAKLGVRSYSELEIAKSIRYSEFTFLNLSDDAKNRVELYKLNLLRNESDLAASSASSIDDYLISLEFSLTFYDAKTSDLDRIEELIQRTNQQNLLLNRTPRTDIVRYIDDRHIFMIRLSDKFGDYGVIGVVLYDLVNGDVRLQELAISCRALGKKVEEAILTYLNNRFSKSKHLYFKFKLTKTNQNFYDILVGFGYEVNGDNLNYAISNLRPYPVWFKSINSDYDD